MEGNKELSQAAGNKIIFGEATGNPFEPVALDAFFPSRRILARLALFF